MIRVTATDVDMVLNPAGRGTQTSFSSLSEDVRTFYLTEAINRVVGSLPPKYADMLQAINRMYLSRASSFSVPRVCQGGVQRFEIYKITPLEGGYWDLGPKLTTVTTWPPDVSEFPADVEHAMANIWFEPNGPLYPPTSLKSLVVEACILSLMKSFVGWRASVSYEEWEGRRKFLENELRAIHDEEIAVSEFDCIPRIDIVPRRAGQVRSIPVKFL